MAMALLVEKTGIPLISLSGAVVVVEPVKKWIFKTPQTDRMAAEKVFEDMKKRTFHEGRAAQRNQRFRRVRRQ